MDKNLHITAAAILTTLAIAGCTIGEDTPTATNTASPQPIAQPSANPQTQAQPFQNPVISSVPTAPTAQAGNLTPPTNSTERLAIVQKGRTDPFGQIVPSIGTNTVRRGNQIEVPKLPPLPTSPNTRQIPGNTPTPNKAPTTAPKSPAGAAQVPQKPKPQILIPKVLSGVVAPMQLKPVVPPIPQPETARAVVVSGVVLVGTVPQAIIKVPDEPTSRYVKPGQRLVNGVLVKRIEMNKGDNPIVIFEQYGIEVAKQVGEQPTQESKPSTTASVGNAISVVKPQENLVGAS
ncbi:hypothetical protein FJR38_08925 [Anabaena sp. UHCC 0253]|jgi:hypothetical protein|uniref:hypothetical protein n=1 Tax=Anabaena sp. UHCC 0253 TaxID=2590019 RepID=UPI001444EC38|nr:hypothetical protein [Anabaena sp. UHCC 0253]MTJ52774.1 hypothetical protein [Anabaena sp. UHCC 0253]